MTSGPVLVMVWEGDNIISVMRGMMGKTNPVEAAPGTIRGDFAQQTGRNIIHGSDSPESAKREIELFFNDYELLNYEACNKVWLCSSRRKPLPETHFSFFSFQLHRWPLPVARKILIGILKSDEHDHPSTDRQRAGPRGPRQDQPARLHQGNGGHHA